MTGPGNPNNAPLSPFASREPASPPTENAASNLGYPLYELSVRSLRELDRLAIEEFGIPGIVLMENAARALSVHALSMLADLGTDHAVIFCGPGNNGGDGLALARHLANHHARVTVVLAHNPEAFAGDALTNLRVVQRMGLEIVGRAGLPDLGGVLIVDALFGTGLSRPTGGVYAELIRLINSAGGLGSGVLAVDCPSGLDAQSGTPMDPCVLADRTVTLAALKPGFASLGAQHALGHVGVEDIGAPIELLARLGNPVRRPAGAGGDCSQQKA